MLYCSSECGSIWSRSCARHAQFIATRMYMCTFHVCLRLLALTFVCNSTYLLKCSFQIYQKSIVVLIRSLIILFKTTSCANNTCMFSMSVLATGPGCIINIYVILERRNLFEMGAVRSARESRSVALVWRLGILVTGALFCAQGKQQ